MDTRNLVLVLPNCNRSPRDGYSLKSVRPYPARVPENGRKQAPLKLRDVLGSVQVLPAMGESVMRVVQVEWSYGPLKKEERKVFGEDVVPVLDGKITMLVAFMDALPTAG